MTRRTSVERAGQARLDALLADVEEFDDLDAAHAEVRQRPYGFVWEGQKWVLPYFGSLDWRTQQKFIDADELDMDGIHALFAELFGEAQAARWNETVQPSDKMPLLFRRWFAHGRAKQGEGEASNDSSENTGENSRPTSDPSTDSDSPKPSGAPTAEELALLLPANSST